MAIKLAKQLGIKHRYNEESRLAGFPWLQLFPQRNPRLSVRESEGVEAYFQLLATGIVPFNPSAIPDDDYVSENYNIPEVSDAVENIRDPYGNSRSLDKASAYENQKPSFSWQTVGGTVPGEQNEPHAETNANTPDDNQLPCCSWQTVGESIPEESNEPPAETDANTPVKCTPEKILNIISPVVSAAINSVRTRSKQLAEIILTIQAKIDEKRKKGLRKHIKKKRPQREEQQILRKYLSQEHEKNNRCYINGNKKVVTKAENRANSVPSTPTQQRSVQLREKSSKNQYEVPTEQIVQPRKLNKPEVTYRTEETPKFDEVAPTVSGVKKKQTSK
ncbi:unnamed protein product [Phaedon cochleariae]|uniref:Uncharacterized protein n=1 Tax=Phaedon cochleariae TaxID=80249 RepID=A0A9N9SJU8_PHACE|nr:unnamed protein product [Phaedon cochleariae]